MGIKFPTPWKTLIIKFPPSRDGKGVKCLGYAVGGEGGRAGDVEASIWPIHKPPNCTNCGHHLGGTFQGARFKKTKSASPEVVEITQGVFSCRTTGRDDWCFVTSSGDMWLCTHEACKVSRSIYINSDLASQYECNHVKHAKNTDVSGSLPPTYQAFLATRAATPYERIWMRCRCRRFLLQHLRSFKYQIKFLPSSDCPLQAIRLVFVMSKERAGTKVAILARLKTAVPSHPKWKGQQPKPSVSICICYSPGKIYSNIYTTKKLETKYVLE